MAFDLRSKEIDLVCENFNSVSERDDHLYGVFEGDAKSLEKYLESYVLISSTSFIRAETHVKSKEHKRFNRSARCKLVKLLAYNV